LTGFRVDLGTRYVTVRVLQEGVGGKLSAVFLQPIQNPSYMSHVLLLCILTFICLRATSLSYDVAHCTVRS
jgi:hypothetical protein